MRAIDLHLELSHVTPPVWRVIRVPAELRLDDLHHAIQAVMGWDDFHPHLFEVGAKEYGPRPDADEGDEDDEGFVDPGAWAGDDRALTVAQALADSASGFTYIYDFAEEWRVRVTRQSESVGEETPMVVCVAGEHAGPQQQSRSLDPFTLDVANRRLQEARRPHATPEFPAGPRAHPDQQLLANLSLAMLMLGSRPTRRGTREAWKHVRVEILDALTDAGLIESDPARKSVTITDAGVAHAQRLLQKLRTL